MTQIKTTRIHLIISISNKWIIKNNKTKLWFNKKRFWETNQWFEKQRNRESEKVNEYWERFKERNSKA